MTKILQENLRVRVRAGDKTHNQHREKPTTSIESTQDINGRRGADSSDNEAEGKDGHSPRGARPESVETSSQLQCQVAPYLNCP